MVYRNTDSEVINPRTGMTPKAERAIWRTITVMWVVIAIWVPVLALYATH